MVTSAQCFKKYGSPSHSNQCMVSWDVPGFLEIGAIPKTILCNKDLVQPLSKAFQELIRTGYVKELNNACNSVPVSSLTIIPKVP